ncbi:hypothetical protein [Nitrosospira sp. Nsp1]|uniref:hypothetical protein n=1 Tax=Nitrosospira sp. Nsp1 TaxID=136547 RepID=UPI00088172AE|nr:hypothetical protein [Nitrosospira sp. Nsp1]SCX41327.1 hypothetical protein SAMN05720354_103231 [Nitrosospira sp. Nsp1]
MTALPLRYRMALLRAVIHLGSGQQFVGLEGNRLQKRLAGSYFADFSINRITTIGLQNLPSPSHFFDYDSSSPTGC